MPAQVPEPLASYTTEKATRSQYCFAQKRVVAAGETSYVWHNFKRSVAETSTRRVFASVDDADAWRAAQPANDNVTYSTARRINDCGWAELVETATEYGDWEDLGEVE